MANSRSKAQSAKTRPTEPKRQKARPTSGTVKKPQSKLAHELDKVVHEFDGAVDELQNTLEKLRATLPEIIGIGVHRELMQRLRFLADDGILDNLQRLAMALENSGPAGLPELLLPLQRSARTALDRICRTFEIEKVYLPGDSLTVTQDQAKDFDWSTDLSYEMSFPVQVEVLRSGWKFADTVFVLPRISSIRP